MTTMESLYQRQELNRMVKAVFVRHMADLSIIYHSCSQNTATIHGILRKLIGSDFTMQEVNALLKELSRLPNLKRMNFCLENWDISDRGDSWHIKLICPVRQYFDKPDNILTLKDSPDGNQ